MSPRVISNLPVLTDRHPRERRRRSPLRAGGEDHGLRRRELAIRTALFAWESQISEPLGRLDVVDERAADQYELCDFVTPREGR